MGDSKESCGVNPKYLATAVPGGISFEISPFGNQHHRVIGTLVYFRHFRDYESCKRIYNLTPFRVFVFSLAPLNAQPIQLGCFRDFLTFQL